MSQFEEGVYYLVLEGEDEGQYVKWYSSSGDKMAVTLVTGPRKGKDITVVVSALSLVSPEEALEAIKAEEQQSLEGG